ncbi:hypothetical protein [Streptomyces sp. UNOC14_S4]|uniref:hypothetical protein n=1 Tax=Streptomyces sp. UNOC14_S4 TaxID=2872340 RepID=UPI0027E2D454|nr:hypothetical protein [Streptomyces sp. UNOC14_S4]MCC3767109.1 hypothetical protein [Streptomyces sp. UNOC14_S4]
MGTHAPGLCELRGVDRAVRLGDGPGHVAHEEMTLREPDPVQRVAASGFPPPPSERGTNVFSGGFGVGVRVLSHKVEEPTACDTRQLGLIEI